MASINSSEENFVEWIQHLNNVSEMILTNDSLDNTTNRILEILNTNLDSLFLLYLKIDNEHKNIVLHSFSQKYLSKVTKFIKFDLYKIKYPLGNIEPLITKCIAENKIMTSEHLRDFFYPVFKWKLVLDKIQQILKVNYCMAVPMKIGNKVSGAFFAATMKKDFTPLEIELIKFYSNQLRIASDKDQKMKQLEAQYLLEKETSSVLAHELKTPIAIALNNINMASGLLEMKKDCKDEWSLVKKAKEAIDKLNRICNSVMALREVETEEVSAIHELHLQDSFFPVIENFERLAKEKGLNFNYSLKFKLGKFYGGGAQFEQILTILLDNALKYTEKGSVDINLESDGKRLRGIVSNTGYKIPKNKRKTIFKRFYRHRDDDNKGLYHTSGLGLGLYIALKLTEHLKGSIEVKNAIKENGNQFIVEIPIYDSQEKINKLSHKLF